MVPQDEGKGQEKQAIVSLVWPAEIELPTLYANQLYISYTGQEFYLVFGEAIPPTMVNASDVRGGKKKVFIEPVVRIAVSYESMAKMMDAMTKNYNSFMDKVKAAIESETAEEGT